MAELEMNCCGLEGWEPCGCAPAEATDIRDAGPRALGIT
jgi:hypothetical protein